MDTISWVLILLIFFARVLDVSLGTMRIIFVSRNLKKLAPIVGFFEVLIWIIVIGQVMQNLNSIAHYVAYAAGFAAGNYVGIVIEEKLAVGYVLTRIISKEHNKELIDHLRDEKCGVTVVDAHGKQGNVKILFSVIKRKKLYKVYEAIEKYSPNSFVSVEDIKTATDQGFLGVPVKKKRFQRQFRTLRKGK